MSVLTHANVVPRVTEFGEFEQMSGGDPQGTFADWWPPGAKIARKVSSIGAYTDITMTRAYDTRRDKAIIDRWNQYLYGVNQAPVTIIKQFRNQLGVIEDSHVYLAKIKEIKTPDAKSGDNGVAEIQVTFVVEALL